MTDTVPPRSIGRSFGLRFPSLLEPGVSAQHTVSNLHDPVHVVDLHGGSLNSRRGRVSRLLAVGAARTAGDEELLRGCVEARRGRSCWRQDGRRS